ncbi:MAG TPA: response regulator [Candidatus Nitrosopolaris sp.]|nr:response regulator [Candidatus Nitrosopolaris sp.]
MINKDQKNLGPRIMVVDDEKDILRILKRDLESSNLENRFNVEIFSTSESALNAFASHPDDYYDLVLTDIRMSKMTGFELYRRLKEKSPSIKIVFLTAFEIDKKEFDKVLAGAHFINKPVSISNLVPKLYSILEKK